MGNMDKGYYKINVDGYNHIYTNVQKSGDHYIANEVLKNGNTGEFVHSLSKNEIKNAQRYDVLELAQREQNFVFAFKMTNNAENDKDKGVWLCFPTTKEEVSRAFEYIGLPNTADSKNYTLEKCVFGNEYDSCGYAEHIIAYDNDIDRLNYLASRITELDDLELNVFYAAIQTEDIENIADLINVTYNTEYYNVVDNMFSWENVGSYIAEKNGLDVGAMGELAEYIDYAAYGKDYAKSCDGELAEDVFIEKGCTEWENVFNGDIEIIPSEYIVTKNGECMRADYIFDMQFEESKDIAVDIDRHMRKFDKDYAEKYNDIFEQMKYFSDCLLEQRTLAVKDMLTATNTLSGDELVDKICDFEQKYPTDRYMIYQLKDGEDTRNYRFASYKELQSQGLNIDKSNYELKYVCGLSDNTTVESLFIQFNNDLPQDFIGRSMSVSDIVVMCRNGEEKAYFCDSIGFVEVPEFLSEQPAYTNQHTMSVLVVEPLNTPYVKEIDTGLKSLQAEVGGYIQSLYPFEEEVAIVCNDEGKNLGLPLNRALYDEDGEIYDIIAGTFLVVGLGEEDFSSLSPSLQQQFENRFKNPEIFVRINEEIRAINVKPSIRNALNKLKQENNGNKEQHQKKPPSQEI